MGPFWNTIFKLYEVTLIALSLVLPGFVFTFAKKVGKVRAYIPVLRLQKADGQKITLVYYPKIISPSD